MAFFVGNKGDGIENKDSVKDYDMESDRDLRKYSLFMIERDFKKFNLDELSTSVLPRLSQILAKNINDLIGISDLNEKDELVRCSGLLKKTVEYFPRIVNEIISQHKDDLEEG